MRDGVGFSSEKLDGPCFPVDRQGVFRIVHRLCAERVSGDEVMMVLYIISAVLAGFLLMYLFVAMLKPEWF